MRSYHRILCSLENSCESRGNVTVYGGKRRRERERQWTILNKHAAEEIRRKGTERGQVESFLVLSFFPFEHFFQLCF